MRNLTIDPERLWGNLMETAAIGGTPKGGICRLTLTDLDRQVRDWFRARAEALGCTVTVDDMGVMFARREGQRADVPPIAMGSHLDTQPTGGKFDGALGVLGALEALQALHAAGYETFAPIEVVNWTNEEGSRFQPGCVASGVFGGVYQRDWAMARTDRTGVAFGDALGAIGYQGPQRCGDHPLSAFFELHIEQGPLLEAESKEIGIVTGIQGVRWYEATITGRESHAGTTPMPRRADAFVACARLALEVQAIALARAPTAVGTVGRVEVEPNSPNVIPGVVRMTVDLRHHDDGVLQDMEESLYAAIEQIAGDDKVRIESRKLHDLAAVKFHPDCVAAVRAGAEALGLSHRDIISGAGHDAVHLSTVTPTAMIFVPCKDGLSHNEAESATIEHCAAGAQVLLEAALMLDAKLSSAR